MQILIFLLLVLIFIVVATTKFKLHPFLSLIFASLIMGFVAGMNGIDIVTKLTEGFGNTLKNIGIIIAFGTIIGAFLEKSGGTRVMAGAILRITGLKRAALAMNLTGLIVSIPVFCDSGFIILSSLNKALSKKSGISLTVLAISLSAGLYATHVFVPPTPGPLAAAAALNADLGLVILLGLLVAIPASFAGYLWAQYIGKKIHVSPDEKSENSESSSEILPGFWASITPILVPIVLIALKSFTDYPGHPLGEGLIFKTISFIGNPIIALFIGVLLSFNLIKSKKKEGLKWTSDGLKEAGTIILITGAGGAFGNILRASGIGDIIGSNFSDMQVGIILPFLVAAILKSAQGSSTVSIITTAAIIAPMLESLGLISPVGKALAVLSIGAGAMTVSHVNDSYFWVVSQFSGLNVASALKSQTVATFFQGLTALAVIAVLSAILT